MSMLDHSFAMRHDLAVIAHDPMAGAATLMVAFSLALLSEIIAKRIESASAP